MCQKQWGKLPIYNWKGIDPRCSLNITRMFVILKQIHACHPSLGGIVQHPVSILERIQGVIMAGHEQNTFQLRGWVFITVRHRWLRRVMRISGAQPTMVSTEPSFRRIEMSIAGMPHICLQGHERTHQTSWTDPKNYRMQTWTKINHRWQFRSQLHVFILMPNSAQSPPDDLRRIALVLALEARDGAIRLPGSLQMVDVWWWCVNKCMLDEQIL